MAPPKVTLNDYQHQSNVYGLITTNQISHAFRPEPSRSIEHPVESTIYNHKPLEIMIENPFILHDTYVTTNKVIYTPKFRENEFVQPQHVKAPGLCHIHYIKPDFHRKVAKGDFNLNPIYDKSETHDKFQVKRRLHDVIGSPVHQITHRDVFLPINKDAVFYFDQDEPHSLIRNSHPYLTTNQMTHRRFSTEELEKQKMLNAFECGAMTTNSDVAIKLRIRPMVDPYEQLLPNISNLEQIQNFPSALNESGQKHYFRKSLYKGCPPRVFPPVEHFGSDSTYRASFSLPNSSHTKNNFTNPVKICYLQPKPSSLATMRVPNMYSTESKLYGSGRHVSTYVKLRELDICGHTCVA